MVRSLSKSWFERCETMCTDRYCWKINNCLPYLQHLGKIQFGSRCRCKCICPCPLTSASRWWAGGPLLTCRHRWGAAQSCISSLGRFPGETEIKHGNDAIIYLTTVEFPTSFKSKCRNGFIDPCLVLRNEIMAQLWTVLGFWVGVYHMSSNCWSPGSCYTLVILQVFLVFYFKLNSLGGFASLPINCANEHCSYLPYAQLRMSLYILI